MQRNKPQLLKCFFRKLRVGVFDTEGTLGLYAFGKKLVVHILHDHIGTLHALLRLLRISVPQIRAGRFLVQTAERTGEGRFPRAVVSDNGNDISGRGLQGDIAQHGLLFISQRHILKFQHRQLFWCGCTHWLILMQVQRPQSHALPLLSRQQTELLRRPIPGNRSVLKVNDAVCHIRQIM